MQLLFDAPVCILFRYMAARQHKDCMPTCTIDTKTALRTNPANLNASHLTWEPFKFLTSLTKNATVTVCDAPVCILFRCMAARQHSMPTCTIEIKTALRTNGWRNESAISNQSSEHHQRSQRHPFFLYSDISIIFIKLIIKQETRLRQQHQ
jgi:hypothetical protein